MKGCGYGAQPRLPIFKEHPQDHEMASQMPLQYCINACEWYNNIMMSTLMKTHIVSFTAAHMQVATHYSGCTNCCHSVHSATLSNTHSTSLQLLLQTVLAASSAACISNCLAYI
jgi:hypothetical protein